MFPATTVVEIENTHNRAGGVVFPQDEAVRICALARERGIATFLDGARLWNAAVASGRSEAELAAPFDLVAVAFSKGLGAPAGSLLAGPHDADPTRQPAPPPPRRRDAAGGHPGGRRAARRAAPSRAAGRGPRQRAVGWPTRLAACGAVQLDLASVQTNIVVFHLRPARRTPPTVVAQARAQGVLLGAFGPRTVRAVTHLDVSAAQCDEAAQRLAAYWLDAVHAGQGPAWDGHS